MKPDRFDQGSGIVMHAEVMAIGDELTSGQRLDTNSQWVSLRLGEIGVPVRFHTTVGDELEDLVGALRVAFRRAPLVVITGGLGPTADDLTRQAMAEAGALPLELRADALADVIARFQQRGREMPPQNRVQAMFPAGSLVIPNPHGTAPGIDLTVNESGRSCRLFALPGVPAEMKEMWYATVQPAISSLLGTPRIIRHRRVKCFGVGESQLEAMLPDLIHRERTPRVGITVHQATITLRVTASGRNEAECQEQMEPTLQTIRDCLGDLVFGEEDDELEHVVLRRLMAERLTLAVCEWGTAGLVGRWLAAAAPPVDSPLIGCFTVGSAGALASVLEIGSEVTGADRVRAMADQTRRRTGADLVLAIGPLPHPDQPAPRIHLALATANSVRVVERSYAAHPDVVLDRAAKQALDLLRLELGARASQSSSLATPTTPPGALPACVELLDPDSGARAKVLVGFGFNLYSLRMPVDGLMTELLWAHPEFAAGQQRPSGSGVPILFPFPGRIRQGELHWQGRDYRLPLNDGQGNAIHGFVHHRPWRILHQTRDQITGEFRAAVDAPELLRLWPGDFQIQTTYRLAEGKLSAEYVIRNPGEQPLPCGLGLHPYFALPLGPTGSAEDCRLRLPVSRRWMLDGMNATGEQQPVAPEFLGPDGVALAGQPFDHVFGGLLPEGGPYRAQIIDPLRNAVVSIDFAAPFRECVLFTPPHRAAVCIEPYTCVPDPVRLAANGIDAGLLVLSPGEQQSLTMTVAVAVKPAHRTG